MQDPSHGVARELLPHIHLLSTYRFPILQSIHPEKVTEYLLNAPKIAREAAPFLWTYLDRPADGSMLMTWQPLEMMGTNFASDGYIWGGAEMAFQLEVAGGYMLEMYQHKVGFAPGEPMATHARRRYRLMPPRVPNTNHPAPDGSLWIIHYAPAEPHDRVPANVIPVTGHIQQMMQTRNYLQTQGQIVQKEFMLHDRANWPQIPFPRGHPQARPPPHGYPQAAMVQPRVPQAMSYPPHVVPGAGGPPTKRPRTQPPGPPVPGVMPLPDGSVDEEEDTSRGDFFDHVTPREISVSRYKQNHEWMEELFSSPYAIHQLVPVDLGLGLKGELNGLTEGIFDAPTGLPSKDAKSEYAGRLDPAQAEEFRKRVNSRVTDTQSEIEKMKAQHAKRMAKFQTGSVVSAGETDLRDALHDPSNVGSEYWRLEGRVEEQDDEHPQPVKVFKKVDDIVAQVEASLGRHISAVQELKRIQDGGLEERQPTPPTAGGDRHGSQHGNGSLMGDLDLGNSAGGLLDQFHTGLSSTSTPHAHLQIPSAAGTPGMTAASPSAAAHALKSAPGKDIDMGDASKDDWVVVPPGGMSSSAAALASVPGGASASEALGTPAAGGSASGGIGPGSLGTPGFTADVTDFGSLDDLDTAAGDALASYGGDDDGTGVGAGDLDLSMDLGLDDSAFGDAFHGVGDGGGA